MPNGYSCTSIRENTDESSSRQLAFRDEPEYLRRRLPVEAHDELICPDEDICPMLERVDVVISRMGRVGRRSGVRKVSCWRG
jgi:hypothetical protein